MSCRAQWRINRKQFVAEPRRSPICAFLSWMLSPKHRTGWWRPSEVRLVTEIDVFHFLIYIFFIFGKMNWIINVLYCYTIVEIGKLWNCVDICTSRLTLPTMVYARADIASTQLNFFCVLKLLASHSTYFVMSRSSLKVLQRRCFFVRLSKSTLI